MPAKNFNLPETLAPEPAPQILTSKVPLTDAAPDTAHDADLGEETLGDDQEPERVEIVVPHLKERERIDKFLARQVGNATRNKVQTAIDDGRVTVNGQAVKSNYKLRPADKIEVIFTHPPAPELKPEAIALEVLFEDEFLMVINKAAGMVVHPAYANWTGTLASAVLYHVQQQQQTLSAGGGNLRPGIVHRLDKDTSGVMVVAKADDMHYALAKQFADRTTEKNYTALAWGVPKEKSGVIQTNISRSMRDRKVMANYPFGGTTGKEAVTEYDIEENLTYFSLLDIRLHTGRTHQIRVHLQHIGHPVVSDEAYGGKSVRKLGFPQSEAFVKNLFEVLPRQALHARTLSFIHPKTNRRVRFEAPLPPDIVAALEKVRRLT